MNSKQIAYMPMPSMPLEDPRLCSASSFGASAIITRRQQVGSADRPFKATAASHSGSYQENCMDRHRRGFLSAGAALVASQVAGVGAAAEPAARDGHKAYTLDESRDMAAQRFNGHYTCVRTMQSDEGPYYYESSPRRSDITEGRKGVPLRLRILVANALNPGNTCSALAGAVVDIWQADADGMYSNVGPEFQHADTLGQTFLRGHQVTDATGYVEFQTIVP